MLLSAAGYAGSCWELLGTAERCKPAAERWLAAAPRRGRSVSKLAPQPEREQGLWDARSIDPLLADAPLLPLAPALAEELAAMGRCGC